jgi:predicted nucleic acid-binding protein
VIVVDASVLATALGDDGPDGDHARARLRGERLSAPELVDLEVTSVLRRQVHSGAAQALADLAALPLRRTPHRPLLARCWELRDNLTVYDASYVALAEALEVTLLTGDGRLAHAPGLRCHVEILRPTSLSGASKLPVMVAVKRASAHASRPPATGAGGLITSGAARAIWVSGGDHDDPG